MNHDARARHPAPGEPVLTPCLRVCVMDNNSGFCQGCFRTLDEILNWPACSNPQRREIMAKLAGRKLGVVS